MSNSSAPAERPLRKLLKGGAAITQAILQKSDEKDIRWLYGQLPHLAGVVWQLIPRAASFSLSKTS